MTGYAANGGGRHLFYISESQVPLAIEYNWLNQTFAILSVTVSKVSVALLILRLLGPSAWRRWFLYLISGLSCLVGSLAVIFIYVQCTPVQTLWDPSVGGACWNLTAVNRYDLFVSSKRPIGASIPTSETLLIVGGFSCFTDFTLALFPLTIIWNLQLNKKKKVGLALLLGSGVL